MYGPGHAFVERPVQLQLKTGQFVDDYLKTKTGTIIPIGSTEAVKMAPTTAAGVSQSGG